MKLHFQISTFPHPIFGPGRAVHSRAVLASHPFLVSFCAFVFETADILSSVLALRASCAHRRFQKRKHKKKPEMGGRLRNRTGMHSPPSAKWGGEMWILGRRISFSFGFLFGLGFTFAGLVLTGISSAKNKTALYWAWGKVKGIYALEIPSKIYGCPLFCYTLKTRFLSN
mgnify:CR=1 FL=1